MQFKGLSLACFGSISKRLFDKNNLQVALVLGKGDHQKNDKLVVERVEKRRINKEKCRKCGTVNKKFPVQIRCNGTNCDQKGKP
mmetsp:Transcript_42269/g.76267  ORF Transcript_42269/g.76267 Transcript_42269/m.76267 type:complete len:84 (-) Transcript_42269:71-322(-)